MNLRPFGSGSWLLPGRGRGAGGANAGLIEGLLRPHAWNEISRLQALEMQLTECPLDEALEGVGGMLLLFAGSHDLL